jgi:hypothetical protein
MTPAAWLIQGEAGTSSKTMCSAFVGARMHDSDADIPSDPDDFRRCWLFAEDVDGVKGNLQIVADMYPWWAPFINRWDEIEATMKAEVKSIRNCRRKHATKTYELMRLIETESYKIRYPESEYKITYRPRDLA